MLSRVCSEDAHEVRFRREQFARFLVPDQLQRTDQPDSAKLTDQWMILELLELRQKRSLDPFDMTDDVHLVVDLERFECHRCGHGVTGVGVAVGEVADLVAGVADQSDSSFSISSAEPEICKIDLLEPNGGEEFLVGDVVAISWTATDSC